MLSSKKGIESSSISDESKKVNDVNTGASRTIIFSSDNPEGSSNSSILIQVPASNTTQSHVTGNNATEQNKAASITAPISLPEFNDWLKAMEIEFFGAEIRHWSDNENIRGIFATRNITKNTIVMKIPFSSVIHDYWKVNERGLLNARSVAQSSGAYLAIMLFYEKKNKNTRFKPYLDILPAYLDNYPIFYNNVERILLRGTDFLSIFCGQNVDINNTS